MKMEEHRSDNCIIVGNFIFSSLISSEGLPGPLNYWTKLQPF